jgi:Xaa-Pro aminopeptidase
VDLGLLDGDIDTLIERGAYKKYYPHGTSHWLGIDVHDVGAYGRSGTPRGLEPGMVLTVEPGLYVPQDDMDAPEGLRGLGIRIEDDIVVTENAPENLTAAAPKEIADLEAICSGQAHDR